MKKLLFGTIFLLVFVWSRYQVPDLQASTWAGQSKVFAHYFMWWDTAGGRSNFPLKPALGWYENQFPTSQCGGVQNDREVKAVVKHIEMARHYGLWGFAVQWTGPRQGNDCSVDHAIQSTFQPALDQALGQINPPNFEWMIVFDSDQWAQRIDQQNPGYDCRQEHPTLGSVVNFDANCKAKFVSDIEYICDTYANTGEYYAKKNGRPLIFLYWFNRWIGSEMGPAIDQARTACGLNPFFIGDFQIGPQAYHDEYGALDVAFYYPAKVTKVDAVSNFVLFGGYGAYGNQCPTTGGDSTNKYMDETNWPFTNGNSRLDQAFINGQTLANSASKPFYPGISAQYFKGNRPNHPIGQFVPDCSNNTGNMPLIRWEEVPGGNYTAASQGVIDQLWDEVDGLNPTPEYIFVNSWNEPYEGTMVEPTISPNDEAYSMHDDFLERLRTYVGEGGQGSYFIDYQLKPYSSGNCLEVAGSSIANGADVVLGTCQNPVSQNQTWIQVGLELIDANYNNQYYNIILGNSNHCLTVWNTPTPYNVVQAHCVGGASSGESNQQWKLVFVVQGGGIVYHKIISKYGNLCLTFNGIGASVTLAACSEPALNQRWTLAPVP